MLMNTRHITRRRFINTTLTTTAAAGATWFDVPQTLAAKGKKAAMIKYGGFPMGIQSFSLRGFGVDGAMEQTNKLGLHFIEFFGAHFPITKDKIKIGEMNKKLAKYDMTISAHGVNGFGSDHAKNEVTFQFAKMAGIKNISANPSPDSFDSLDKLERGGDRPDVPRDDPRPRHTIGDARTHSSTPRVVLPGPLRSGFDQARRVARAELVKNSVVCLSRQAVHGCAIFAQPAVHSALRRARSAVFLPTRVLAPRRRQ